MALELLLSIRDQHPQFRPETVTMALAKTHAALGQQERARQLFDEATQRFGSFEAHAEYAIWAADSGQAELAQQQYAELQAIMQHWQSNRHAKALNRALLRRLEQSRARAGLR